MSMLDGTSMVYNVITQSNKFVTGVNINAIGDSRLIDSPAMRCSNLVQCGNLLTFTNYMYALII